MEADNRAERTRLVDVQTFGIGESLSISLAAQLWERQAVVSRRLQRLERGGDPTGATEYETVA